MRIWKRALSIGLAAVLTAAVATGCHSGRASSQVNSSSKGGGASSDVNPAGVFPITKDKITISVYADIDPKADVNNNSFLKWFAEKTNVTLKVTARPSNSSDTTTTKNLLLASGNYPEMFLMQQPSAFSMSEMLEYGEKDKILVPLNSYLKEYGDNFKKIYGQFPQLEKIMAAPDGNIYGLNNADQCGHCQAYPKMWVNMDWLNKLHMQVPTTTDEFEQMLKAFKEQDPGGVGSKNVIPLTSDLDETLDYWLMNSFVPYSPNTAKWLTGSNECYVDQAGTIHFAANTDAFKQGLTYMHKLYAEGLVDPAAFSQTMAQAQQTVEKKPERVGAFVAMHIGCDVDINDKATYGAYHAIDPLKGPDGAQYQCNVYGNSWVNQNTGAYVAITDKCKNPAAAFRVLDYFMDPTVTMMKENGTEGTDWQTVPAGSKNVLGGEDKYRLINLPANSALSNSKMNRTFGAGSFLNTYAFRQTYQPNVSSSVLNSDPSYYESRLEVETEPLTKFFYPYDLPNQLFMDEDDMSNFSEMAKNINTYVGKSVAQFVTGGENLDSDWNTYVQTLDQYKLKDFLSLYQKAFDSYNKGAK